MTDLLFFSQQGLVLSQPLPENVCGCLVEGIICLIPSSHTLCCAFSSLRLLRQPGGLLSGSLLALFAFLLLRLWRAACKAGLSQARGAVLLKISASLKARIW